MSNLKILAIETSCDETALAILESSDKNDFKILGSALNSQIEVHKEYGGVFPSLAKREHAKNIIPLLDNLLLEYFTKYPDDIDSNKGNFDKAEFATESIDWNEIEKILEREPDLFEHFKEYISNNKRPNIDVLAVTSGPGLAPALWVGINFAKALSLAWQIPLLPINHMEGHIVSVLTETKIEEFPSLALLISGGHTELVLIKEWGDYKVLGETQDDAIGEAYDKVARMLNLPYPGGPEISKLAKEARDTGLNNSNNSGGSDDSSDSGSSDIEISFPRPMLNSGDYNFSLSGLKTSVLYKTQEIEKEFGEVSDLNKKIIAKEFEEVIKDVLIKKTSKALKEFNIKNLIVGGGVIANQYLRDNLEKTALENNAIAVFPTKELSTDNAVMIAIAGIIKARKNIESQLPIGKINPEIKAEGNLSL